MIIGVVGKSGSGKNYISEEMSVKTGFTHFDLDLYGHKAIDTMGGHIYEMFGEDVLTDDKKSIDRYKLSNIVFKSKRELRKLELCTRAWIEMEVYKDMKQEENVILNGAVLHKSQLVNKCDYVVYVKAPLWKRVYRLYKRDNKSIIHILRRIYSQSDISSRLYEKCIVVHN